MTFDAKEVRDTLELGELNTDNYEAFVETTWNDLEPGHQEQLNQLVHQGPVWDGNVISKRHRDALLNAGLAVRVGYMGQHGYTAATYFGVDVFKAGKMHPYPVVSPGKD